MALTPITTTATTVTAAAYPTSAGTTPPGRIYTLPPTSTSLLKSNRISLPSRKEPFYLHKSNMDKVQELIRDRKFDQAASLYKLNQANMTAEAESVVRKITDMKKITSGSKFLANLLISAGAMFAVIALMMVGAYVMTDHMTLIDFIARLLANGFMAVACLAHGMATMFARLSAELDILTHLQMNSYVEFTDAAETE